MYDWSRHHRFIVYGLTDPRTGEVRYVGRSSMGPARPIEHATRATREKTHKAAWVRSLLRDGLMYGVITLEACGDTAETIEAEKKWIAHGRAVGWRLTNLTSGGEGATRKKVALPDAEIAARYAVGESEQSLAANYGVQRWTIRRRLIEAGAEIRGRSAANANRMRKMTADQRKQLAAAANEARRSGKHSGRRRSLESF